MKDPLSRSDQSARDTTGTTTTVSWSAMPAWVDLDPGEGGRSDGHNHWLETSSEEEDEKEDGGAAADGQAEEDENSVEVMCHPSCCSSDANSHHIRKVMMRL